MGERAQDQGLKETEIWAINQLHHLPASLSSSQCSLVVWQKVTFFSFLEGRTAESSSVHNGWKIVPRATKAVPAWPCLCWPVQTPPTEAGPQTARVAKKRRAPGPAPSRAWWDPVWAGLGGPGFRGTLCRRSGHGSVSGTGELLIWKVSCGADDVLQRMMCRGV